MWTPRIFRGWPSLDGDDVIELFGSQCIPIFSTRTMDLYVYYILWYTHLFLDKIDGWEVVIQCAKSCSWKLWCSVEFSMCRRMFRTFHDFLLAEFDIEGIFVNGGARAIDFSPAGSLVLLWFSLGTYPSSCSRLHHAFFFYLWCHCQLRQEIWSYCWLHIDESHMWLRNWASHVWVRDNCRDFCLWRTNSLDWTVVDFDALYFTLGEYNGNKVRLLALPKDNTISMLKFLWVLCNPSLLYVMPSVVLIAGETYLCTTAAIEECFAKVGQRGWQPGTLETLFSWGKNVLIGC